MRARAHTHTHTHTHTLRRTSFHFSTHTYATQEARATDLLAFLRRIQKTLVAVGDAVGGADRPYDGGARFHGDTRQSGAVRRRCRTGCAVTGTRKRGCNYNTIRCKHTKRQKEPINKGGHYLSKDVTQTQQHGPGSLTVALTWHANN